MKKSCNGTYRRKKERIRLNRAYAKYLWATSYLNCGFYFDRIWFIRLNVCEAFKTNKILNEQWNLASKQSFCASSFLAKKKTSYNNNKTVQTQISSFLCWRWRWGWRTNFPLDLRNDDDGLSCIWTANKSCKTATRPRNCVVGIWHCVYHSIHWLHWWIEKSILVRVKRCFSKTFSIYLKWIIIIMLFLILGINQCESLNGYWLIQLELAFNRFVDLLNNVYYLCRHFVYIIFMSKIDNCIRFEFRNTKWL